MFAGNLEERQRKLKLMKSPKKGGVSGTYEIQLALIISSITSLLWRSPTASAIYSDITPDPRPSIRANKLTSK